MLYISFLHDSLLTGRMAGGFDCNFVEEAIVDVQPLSAL